MKLLILAELILVSLLISPTPSVAQQKSLYEKYCYTQSGELGWKRNANSDDPFSSPSCQSMGSGETCGTEDGGLCVSSSGKLGQCIERGTWPNEYSQCLELATY